MEFLKKHYEKVILSVVLLGLAVAAALLPMKVSEAQEKVNETRDKIIPPKVKERPPLNLTTNLAILARVARPKSLDLGLPHYLFNPVQWQRRPDGSPWKIKSADDIGPGALTITAVHPLHLDIEFETVSGEADSLRYTISVLKETESRPRKKNYLSKPNSRNETFTLKEVRGPVEAPTELVLELVEDKRIVTISKEKPFRQVIGYMADLKYEPQNRPYLKMKKDAKMTIERENYKIIEINEKEVVLSHEPDGKRTVLTYQPAVKP